MTTIHRIATCTVAALTVAAAYLLTASAASASRQPLQPDNPISGPPQTGSGRTTTIVTTGSPWWTFVLVAAAGATFALASPLRSGGCGKPSMPEPHADPSQHSSL